MTLGDILSDGESVPTIGRPVEFSIRKNGRKYRAKAELHPVSEKERHEANRAALKFLRTQPQFKKREDGSEPYIPESELSAEEAYKIIQAALRVPGCADQAFIDTDSYTDFRAGITIDQIRWLNKEYSELIKDEYPEIVSEQQRKEIDEEATGK